MFLNKAEDNKKNYTGREFQRVQLGREGYGMFACSSIKDFKFMVQHNMINNCPITIEDINITEKIFGKDIYALKGKTTRQKPISVVTEYTIIPTELLNAHNDVTITADVLFVQKILFLISMSRKIKFTTMEVLDNRKVSTMEICFERIINFYKHRGFNITTLLMDMEFEPL